MVGYLLQYHPIFLELKRRVGEGRLSRLLYVNSNGLDLKMRRREDTLWACVGTQAQVCIIGQNARCVLFGTLNLRTAHRTVLITRGVGTRAVRAFLRALRRAYRRAGTLWLLADRASGHTARATRALAKRLRIEFVWLPKEWPELNAMDQPWKGLKRDVAANRQATSITELAERAARWVLALTPAQARRKSGIASDHFWLRNLLQHFWQPT